jgi:hypothetical protein
MSADPPLRPRDLAVLMLGSGETMPRQRARDQQADRAGLELKRRLLTELVALDPEPDELEAALLRIVTDLGPPTGPTRALALAFLDEWRSADLSPQLVSHLLDEATHPDNVKRPRRGAQLPG